MTDKAADERDHLFIEFIRSSSRPLSPLPPSPLPDAFADKKFSSEKRVHGFYKAVIFDIYGTLLVSSAGDIAADGGYRRASIDALAATFAPGRTGEELKDYFRRAVLREHERLFPLTPFPEVRVDEIWSGLPGLASGAKPEELALRYELAVNPCYPMPDAAAAIAALRDADIVLGLVSNAQAFTPLYFDALFGASMDSLGFSAKLCVYSYLRRRAKPCPDLFNEAVSALAARGIRADEALFVGNDMLNDIFGASNAGLATCLFAGDGRSLRLRSGNPLCEASRCDYVISSLADLPALCGAADFSLRDDQHLSRQGNEKRG